MNNFSSLSSILAALNNSSVFRMKSTMAQVSDKYVKVFEALSEEMVPFRGYQLLRAALDSVSPPAIPFLGLTLTDITFIQ